MVFSSPWTRHVFHFYSCFLVSSLRSHSLSGCSYQPTSPRSTQRKKGVCLRTIKRADRRLTFRMTQRTQLILLSGTPRVMESTGGRLKPGTWGMASDWAHLPVSGSLSSFVYYPSAKSEPCFFFVFSTNISKSEDEKQQSQDPCFVFGWTNMGIVAIYRCSTEKIRRRQRCLNGQHEENQWLVGF